MAAHRGTVSPAAPGQDSDLARLIALEQQLAARLEAAHAAHADLLTRARAEVEAAGSALTSELETLGQTLAEESRTQTAARITEIEQAGAASVRRHEAVGDDVVERFAAEVLAWLQGGAEAGR